VHGGEQVTQKPPENLFHSFVETDQQAGLGAGFAGGVAAAANQRESGSRQDALTITGRVSLPH
jgi:hypothetical protein